MNSRFTIRAKLLLCLSLFAVALIAIVATFEFSVHQNKASFDTLMTDRMGPMADLKVVVDAYAVLIVDTAHKTRNGGMSLPEATKNIADGRANIASHWQRYATTRIEGHEIDLVADTKRQMGTADAGIDKLQEILRRSDRAALDAFVIHELYPLIDPVSTAIGALLDEQMKVATVVTAEAQRTNMIAQIGAFVIAIVGMVIWGFAFLVCQHSVIRPINRLADVMDALARDDRDAVIPYQEQGDEIGRMARASEVFRAAAMARARAEAHAAAAQRQVTGDLRTAIAAIANGDLTRDLAAKFPGEYEPVRHDFNAALAHLRNLIGAVSDSAATIRTGSYEIAQASEDLARRTESSAASLEQTTASVTQMDARLKASANAAARTVTCADQAIATVGGGRAVADEAVQAMSRVSDSARGIDGVIEGLDKIAFQTRVLAMNAAVEAGRAGDAGRGFAVVADLVSALAMRAEEEAKRARDQLTVTQSDIVTAVEAVTRVDGALADITGDVAQVHELLATMAADNQAQSVAITQVSSAIGTMDRATQQNAAMVEQTSAAARNLAGEVGSLAEQAGRFTIDHRRTPQPPRAVMPATTILAMAS